MDLSGGLLEFDDDRAAFALDERFGMRSIATIEFGESEIVRIVYDLLIRSRRGEHACFEIDDYDIFIVKVHGRRDTWRPRVIPTHDASVFENLTRALTGERIRVTRRVRERRHFRVFQFNKDVVRNCGAD